MNILLWICQILLALAFGYSGVMKVSQKREYLVSIGQTGVDGLPYWLIRFIGVTEIFGVIGIIVPWATKILPFVTPVTALCFGFIMIPASFIHYKRKEYKAAVGVNLSLFILSGIVAYMRFTMLS